MYILVGDFTFYYIIDNYDIMYVFVWILSHKQGY